MGDKKGKKDKAKEQRQAEARHAKAGRNPSIGGARGTTPCYEA
jgi:hypothetical protein